ncbi:MAG: NADH-quinone oxidoreductase subunit C [Candidatus Omnitrophica bacterium]|nr:NADH-quinone oxidoreductase subunit C [Candidatus Omnitrophota bacterium]MDD5238050.1 NADH-quinone oxidoreductase subunit C [Candidatus Omnitrophota bacterium]
MDIKDKIREKLGAKIINWQENSPRRIYFEVKKEDIFETAKFLFKDLGLRFSIASGMENPASLEILYHFSNDNTGEFYSVRVHIEDKKNPAIDSITPIFVGAEWIEREIWEMLGINFIGHPNLKRLLLAEDWPQGQYPLRHNHES